MLERYFKLSERGTDVKTEALAGLTTFMTMAYIIFVNPSILKGAFLTAGTDTAPSHLVGSPDVTAAQVVGALTIATCVAAAVGSILMAFWANLPVALAPGMGMNAFFVALAIGDVQTPWRVKLGIVFLSGLIFLALSLVRFRETVMAAVPDAIKFGAAAGIGLFIAFIGLQHAGIVTDHPITLVTLGSLTSPPTLLALFGLAVTGGLLVRKVPGAILIGLFATGILGILTGLVKGGGGFFQIHSPLPIFLKLDIFGALSAACVVPILTFLFFDLFDTVGTLMGVGEEAGLMVDGKLPDAEKALAADAGASVVGSLFGTSTVTSYIESAAGVAAGGRTGLASVVTGGLFILAIFLTPIAAIFGQAVVTAPALIIVGYLMCGALRKIEWSEPTEALPAFLTVILMPATYSISGGLAAGFISYSLLKIVTGRAREAHWIVHAVAWVFIAVYVVIRLVAGGGAPQ